MPLQNKFVILKKIISSYGSCLIAFSGGADSTLLLKVASQVLPRNKILAVTANSATYQKEELEFSREITRQLGVRHKIINTEELKNRRFVLNPVNRCYFCKTELFTKLKEIAKKSGLNFVVDASNVTDNSDFRPGSIAKKELGIHSPLQEAGFTKGEVRKLSRKLGLCTWDKPSMACLASRIPFGTKISPGLLKRINQGELFLKSLGFKQVRLRHYDGLCRIEVVKGDIPRLMSKGNLVVDKLKELGYNYITVDLEGYRTGSLNEVMENG